LARNGGDAGWRWVCAGQEQEGRGSGWSQKRIGYTCRKRILHIVLCVQSIYMRERMVPTLQYAQFGTVELHRQVEWSVSHAAMNRLASKASGAKQSRLELFLFYYFTVRTIFGLVVGRRDGNVGAGGIRILDTNTKVVSLIVPLSCTLRHGRHQEHLNDFTRHNHVLKSHCSRTKRDRGELLYSCCADPGNMVVA
jgi:hypothetical protein